MNENKVCALCEHVKGLGSPEKPDTYILALMALFATIVFQSCAAWMLITKTSFARSDFGAFLFCIAVGLATFVFLVKGPGKSIWLHNAKGRYDFAYPDKEKVFHRHNLMPEPDVDYERSVPVFQIRVGGWLKKSEVYKHSLIHQLWVIRSWTGRDLELEDSSRRKLCLGDDAEMAHTVVATYWSVKEALVLGVSGQRLFGRACAGMVDIVMESFLEKSSIKSQPARRVRMKMQKLLARVMGEHVIKRVVALNPKIVEIEGWDRLQKEFLDVL